LKARVVWALRNQTRTTIVCTHDDGVEESDEDVNEKAQDDVDAFVGD
jgi:hypothetical protein